MISVEGPRSFHLGGLASVVEEDRELAWAQPHIRKAPDVKWILGNYVQAATDDVPTYNSNGHLFPYEDLKESIKDLPHRALNINHSPGRRVGTFTAAEFVWPEQETADGPGQPPIVEALAAFWYAYEQPIWPAIQMAHNEGALFFSMEASPEQITCKDACGCDRIFDYKGPQSPTYCDHLNKVAAKKVLHRPHFTAGALIVPPVRPGWKNASIKELSSLLEDDIEKTEALYREIAAETPHLEPKSWENITAWFIAASKKGI